MNQTEANQKAGRCCAMIFLLAMVILFAMLAADLAGPDPVWSLPKGVWR